MTKKLCTTLVSFLTISAKYRTNIMKIVSSTKFIFDHELNNFCTYKIHLFKLRHQYKIQQLKFHVVEDGVYCHLF